MVKELAAEPRKNSKSDLTRSLDSSDQTGSLFCHKYQERREGSGPMTARQPAAAGKVDQPGNGDDMAHAEQPTARAPHLTRGF